MHLTDNQTKVRDALPHDAAAAPATVAETTGLGYSTVTRLMRELADAGLAAKEPDGWRRTDTGNADTDPADIDTDTDAIETEPGSGVAEPNLPDDIGVTAANEPTANAASDEPAADTESEDPTSGAGSPVVDSTDDPGGAIEPAAATAAAEPIDDMTDDDAAEVHSGADEAAPRLPRLRKGQLRVQVLAVLREADEPLGPTQLSKLLEGKSQGAIANACDRLVGTGEAVLTSETPRRFAATPTT